MNDALNLTKGEKVDLTKGNPAIKKLFVGTGWDVNADPTGKSFDLDSSIFLLKEDKSLFNGTGGVIFFGHLKEHGIVHQGDNLTGAGDGDDEIIELHLDQVPADVKRIVIVINIYQAAEKAQHFGMVRNAFTRVFNPETQEVLAKYDLSEDYSGKTGVIMGMVYRHNDTWKFEAMGNGANGDLNAILTSIQTLV